jgi:hypothetical protein
MKRVLYILLLIITGCSNSEQKYLSEADINDLSTYATGALMINKDLYYPIIEAKSSTLNDRQLIDSIVEITNTLNNLASGYLQLASGRNRIEDGSLYNSTASGRDGYRLYNQFIDKQRLRNLLSFMEKRTDPSSKSLASSISYVLDYNILKDNPYFNKERLESRPYSILSLEISILSTNINALLIEFLIRQEQIE